MAAEFSTEIPLFDMEADYATQMNSGPHTLTPEMRQKHRELQVMVRKEMPIRDPFRRSDCDMLYRYLIARKWDLALAAEAIRENNAWRERDRINSILGEKCEDWGDMPQFIGVDRDGHPVQYNCPNSQVLVDLLKAKPKEVLVHRHFIAMERARYLCKHYKSDRISCVVDLTNVGMNGITQVVSFLKEMGTYDQKYYPETMRRMIVCNGGWAITGAWKGIKNFIDPRTQQKISFVSGPPSAKVLSEFIDPSQIPRKYGGSGDEKTLTFDFAQLWDASRAPLRASPCNNTPSSPLKGSATTASPRSSVVGSPRSPQQATQERAVKDAAAAAAAVAAGFPPPATLVASKYESPRLLDENGGEAILNFPSPVSMSSNGTIAAVGMGKSAPDGHCEDSDTETFYSMPSTDDECEDSHAGTLRGGMMGGVTSPGIVIHAENVCDQAIIDDERRYAAKRETGNPNFHVNPRSAAVEQSGGATRLPQPSPRLMSQEPPATLNNRGISSALSGEMAVYERLRSSLQFTVDLGFVDGCYTASVDGVVLGRKMDNVLMHGSSDTLLMTLQREAGHPVHIHHMLIDPKRQVRFVLRKAKLKEEIKIMDIHGDRTFVTVNDNKAKCNGEKVDRYSINQWPGSKDARDWHVWRKGNRHGEEFCMWKQGQHVEVCARMLLDGNTPEVIISLILSLTTIWTPPCSMF